jgi:small subunit ribosomal protein S16
MVKIRLRRVGAKKQASFRVVVADSRSPRDGRFIEEIGFYNPRTEPETLRIKEERALYWLSVGAQPTDSMARLLKSSGTLQRFERLKQGEGLEDLVAEAEEEAAREETAEAVVEAEEPAAGGPDEVEMEEEPEATEPVEEVEEPGAEETAETETEQDEEAPEAVEEMGEPEAEETGTETEEKEAEEDEAEQDEAEQDEPESEADEAEEEDETEE